MLLVSAACAPRTSPSYGPPYPRQPYGPGYAAPGYGYPPQGPPQYGAPPQYGRPPQYAPPQTPPQSPPQQAAPPAPQFPFQWPSSLPPLAWPFPGFNPAPPASPSSPPVNPGPSPAPGATGGCASLNGTWSTQLKVADAQGALGECRDRAGSVTITTSGATARVAWHASEDGADDQATFVASSCTVKHDSPGFGQQGMGVTGSVVYALVIAPNGGLSGTASMEIKGNDFVTPSCKRTLNVTGARK